MTKTRIFLGIIFILLFFSLGWVETSKIRIAIYYIICGFEVSNLCYALTVKFLNWLTVKNLVKEIIPKANEIIDYLYNQFGKEKFDEIFKNNEKPIRKIMFEEVAKNPNNVNEAARSMAERIRKELNV